MIKWDEPTDIVFKSMTQSRGIVICDKWGNVIDEFPHRVFEGLDKFINTGYSKLSEESPCLT